MKNFKLAIIGTGLVIVAILAGCASMTVVGVDNDSLKGPNRVRQYGTIEPKDITVYAFYKDDSRKQYSLRQDDITFDGAKVGPQTVTVKVGGFTASFQTEVMALTGLTVTPQPVVRKLGVPARVSETRSSMGHQGASYDRNSWPGVEIQAVWDQMGSEKLSADAVADECQFTGFNANTAGSQTVTVSWKGVRATFNVNVVTMESLRIASPPTKVTYKQGESLSTAGIRIIEVWPGIGEESYTTVNNNVISGYNANTVGRQTVTITSSNGKTATFQVEVVAMQSMRIESLPTKVTYDRGQSLSLTGLRVIGVWPIIGEETLSITTSDISGYSASTVGRQTLTITKNGRTATFQVEVVQTLNETWVNRANNVDTEYRFNNGNWTMIISTMNNYRPIMQGTYTTNGNKITMTTTGYHSEAGLSAVYGIPLRMYTQEELEAAIRASVKGKTMSDEQIKSAAAAAFLTTTYTYSFSGNTMTMTQDVAGATPFTYTRR